MSQEQFRKDEIHEKLHRQYGHKLASRIIKAAETIQTKQYFKNNKEMDYQKCIDKAVRWVFDTFTREEIQDLKN